MSPPQRGLPWPPGLENLPQTLSHHISLFSIQPLLLHIKLPPDTLFLLHLIILRIRKSNRAQWVQLLALFSMGSGASAEMTVMPGSWSNWRLADTPAYICIHMYTYLYISIHIYIASLGFLPTWWPHNSWTAYMAAQGSKRPRQKLPVLFKGLGTIIKSLLLYSIDQSRPRSTQIQRKGHLYARTVFWQ